jgi:mono/diheme cytochrome c family protein/type 1 glutamine amidotransferase
LFRNVTRVLALAAALVCVAGASRGADLAAAPVGTVKKIVLIGGARGSERPGRHDYPSGIRLLQQFLESSPDVHEAGKLSVVAFPDGWPADPAALQGAANIVWYFDGVGKHPLLDPQRHAQFAALMQQGVGLVALHQASTVPSAADSADMARWLGGARIGMFDRTEEMVAFRPAPGHAISRGVAPFTYFDEFYPTFQFSGGGRVTTILNGRLHPQVREEKHLIIDKPMQSRVAWAFERVGGGRSFGFSGAHYLDSLEVAPLRKLLLNAIFWTAHIEVPQQGVRSGMPLAAAAAPGVASAADILGFHRNAQRSGWFAGETALTPDAVAGPTFGQIWASPAFDAVDGVPPRVYASPLYVDQLTLSAGPHRGERLPVVLAATSNGQVYAVNAGDAAGVAPGTILWRASLGQPCRLEPTPLDGILTGVLATPVIDIARQRLYVTSCDQARRWQAHALALGSGEELPGWPVQLDEASFNQPGMNKNAGTVVPPPKRFDYRLQRGALNLSPDGQTLYVTFGETQTGWLVAVDTATARLASAFASVADPYRGAGGIWGAGGPAVDSDGSVFVATGTGYNGYVDAARNWAQSVLKLTYTPAQGFALRGTYTPFNYCDTATTDIDLGSGGAALMPELPAGATATPRLLTVGGKQGNVYLLNRAHLPGGLARRQPCSTDPASDSSLLAPQAQPQFGGRRGPLNVFGPYSEKDAAIDTARARSVPAYFQAADGAMYVFVTGSTKQQQASPVAVPPSLVRLKAVLAPGQPAYLQTDQMEMATAFENPGSPVVTSNGAAGAIVWLLDTNARRSALLVGEGAPKPVLYAFDALSLRTLWKSAPGELATSGKYNQPAIARGKVFVGTDRIQAYGLRLGVADVAGNDGQAIFKARCAMCHDQAEGRTPPREILATRPRQHIVDALTQGIMRELAKGLSAAEIGAVADYLKSPAALAP